MATATDIFAHLSNPDLLRDALAGLTATPKSLPSKYFYDEEGSRLFEEICDLPEYHVTRTELAMMDQIVDDLALHFLPDSVLFEFGSGASVKTRLLLDAARQIAAYVPIDISASAVEQAVSAISAAYPLLSVYPIVGDYVSDLALPRAVRHARPVGYFPGSTIGNFTPGEAAEFLRAIRLKLGEGARFILGVDLLRDPDRLVAAYDDSQGVTAAFNKNLLKRLNAECDGDFVIDDFMHRALWNAAEGRVEMHLVSRMAQVAMIDGVSLRFEAGETIFTESSYKYLPGDVEMIAASAGWALKQRWISEGGDFGIFLLSF